MGANNRLSMDTELLYMWGDEELTERHQKEYIKYFSCAPGIVLEIGCGRGVMLGLMKDAGIDAYGLDSSKGAIELCQCKELNVIHGDAVGHLQSLSERSLGGIFCGHIIEHLPPESVIELIQESHRVLKPNAHFIIITPNPKDLRTTERFWLDITHIRPYPAKLLVSLMRRGGFSQVKIMEGREPSKNVFQMAAKFFCRMWFLGFIFRGDLVAVAKR